jgi:hypothetical protein
MLAEIARQIGTAERTNKLNSSGRENKDAA